MGKGQGVRSRTRKLKRQDESQQRKLREIQPSRPTTSLSPDFSGSWPPDVCVLRLRTQNGCGVVRAELLSELKVL